MNFDVNIKKETLHPITRKEVYKSLRPYTVFWYTLKFISFLGFIFVIPVWIWLGWGIFWKVLLTSIFIYIPSNFIHAGYSSTKHAWITALKDNNMLIGEEKTEENEIKRKNTKKN